MSYEIFKELCDKHNIKPSRVADLCGIPRTTISQWKHGQYTPKDDKRRKLADFFDVSLEYLDTGKDPDSEYLTAEQIREMYFNEYPEYRVMFEILEDVPAEKMPFIVDIVKGVLGLDK